MKADLYESKPGRANCLQEIFFVIFVPKMLRAAKRLKNVCLDLDLAIRWVHQQM